MLTGYWSSVALKSEFCVGAPWKLTVFVFVCTCIDLHYILDVIEEGKEIFTFYPDWMTSVSAWIEMGWGWERGDGRIPGNVSPRKVNTLNQKSERQDRGWNCMCLLVCMYLHTHNACNVKWRWGKSLFERKERRVRNFWDSLPPESECG
jgi:hypothetical protein